MHRVRHFGRPAKLQVDELGVISCLDDKIDARRFSGNWIGFAWTRLNQFGPEDFLLGGMTSGAARLNGLAAGVSIAGQELPRGLTGIKQCDRLARNFVPITGKAKRLRSGDFRSDRTTSQNRGKYEDGYAQTNRSTLAPH